MDREILYANVMKRFSVRRFVAKIGVDWWLRFHSEPGTYLKNAFESPLFKKRIDEAIKRGHRNPRQRRRMREQKQHG